MMLGLNDAAAAVLTDSGGLQEETTVLGVPCVTLREQTERPVTVTEGTNRMARWPVTAESLRADLDEALKRGRVPFGSRVPDGWDGKAAERIASALIERV
jgi:UDP-N-acetylglucosamine 2-epimerase (non-hydrolysing)